jgi:hypothetical protein
MATNRREVLKLSIQNLSNNGTEKIQTNDRRHPLENW